jgi:hypothetical protein
MRVEKDTLYINSDALLMMGIDPYEGIKYLEEKKAVDMNPAHVKALVLLKQKPAVAS